MNIKVAVDIFKALSDPTRIRIMNLLLTHPGLCVCEIMDILGEEQYNISRHLKVLKNADLTQEKKQGRWVLYYPKMVKYFQETIYRCIKGIEDETLLKDKKMLNLRLSLRENGKCVVGMKSEEWKKLLTKEEKWK